MADRQTLYRKFGPQMIEAMMKLILTQINNLRAQHGLSQFTMEQLSDALLNELNNIPNYDWMNQP